MGNILITGGSEGIGFSMAKACIAKGANVAILARNKQKLSNAAAKLQQINKSSTVLTISADVSDYTAMQNQITSALKDANWNELHAVVCNAGVELVDSLENTSIDSYHRIMNINYFGVVNTVKITLPYLKKNKSCQQGKCGRLLINCSLLGLMSMSYYSAYCASKWALRGFVESIYAELSALNVYTSIVYPPDVKTSQLQREKAVTHIPQSVKDISSGAEVFSPDDVGADMMAMLENGEYNRSWGTDGWMLLNLTAGFGITHSWMDTLTQVFGMGLFRAIGMFYIQDIHNITKKSFCK